MDCLDFARRDDSNPVLCHNDLLAANRLSHDNRLWALDWEYSAMASRWYDLVVVIEGDQLNTDTAQSLIDSYLGRPASNLELELVNGYRPIYRYMEILWYATAGNSALAGVDMSGVDIEERISILYDRVKTSP